MNFYLAAKILSSAANFLNRHPPPNPLPSQFVKTSMLSQMPLSRINLNLALPNLPKQVWSASTNYTPITNDPLMIIVTIVVVSRLAYRKGIDLLVATAPRICAAFPNVRFLVGALISTSSHLTTLIHLLLFPFLPSYRSYHSYNTLNTEGGDGPKLIDLLQMREKHRLQDRIELLGPIRHEDVRSVRPFLSTTPSNPSINL